LRSRGAACGWIAVFAVLVTASCAALSSPSVNAAPVGTVIPRLGSPSPKETRMLELSVKCVDEYGNVDMRSEAPDICRYRRGQELLVLQIGITNRFDREIGFPLSRLQSQGPHVRLVDSRSGASYTLPASGAAPIEYVPLAPAHSTQVGWVIARDELERLGSREVDAVVEITVMVEVKMGDRLVPVSADAKVRVVEDSSKPSRP
jgi:hypothetical protein